MSFSFFARILIALMGGCGVYYSDDDHCKCGWDLPGHVWAVSWLSRVWVVCNNCGKRHEYQWENNS